MTDWRQIAIAEAVSAVLRTLGEQLSGNTAEHGINVCALIVVQARKTMAGAYGEEYTADCIAHHEETLEGEPPMLELDSVLMSRGGVA